MLTTHVTHLFFSLVKKSGHTSEGWYPGIFLLRKTFLDDTSALLRSLAGMTRKSLRKVSQ